MYASSFGLTEAPFSISPDPRYLYMSQRHLEAMAHLRYGIQESGGFVQLTGEVGTGKTTICRCMLDQLPDNIDVALILNPQISHSELLATLCDEIGVSYPDGATPKQLLDLLNEKLIETFSSGRRTVLVIDEAQMLTREVLEQIRVLTNLETTTQKLLQIILIGQPELSAMLSRQDLRQLAQRITARYHLKPLTRTETTKYIKYRLGVAGCHRSLFSRGALRRVFRRSNGVPRLINVICDRAMLGAYVRDGDKVTASMVSRAAREIFGTEPRGRGVLWWMSGVAAAAVILLATVRPQWISADLPIVDPIDVPVQTAPEPSVRVDESAVTPALRPAARPALRAPAETVRAIPDPIPASADTGRSLVPSVAALLDSEGVARSEAAALGRLLEAWGVDTGSAAGDLSCSESESLYGLRCLRGQGNWEEVEAFNRLAALTLKRGGDVAYLLLTGLETDRAILAGADGVHDFGRSEVGAYWDGGYLLLWRAPPEGAETLSEHSEGVDVLWLRQTLSRVSSIRTVDLDNTYFDSSLAESVKAFQKSHNLEVDGIVGAHTIIRLHNVVDPEVPKLGPTAG